MAVPKKRTSRAKRDEKSTHDAISAPAFLLLNQMEV